jgi:hypothetical protein
VPLATAIPGRIIRQRVTLTRILPIPVFLLYYFAPTSVAWRCPIGAVFCGVSWCDSALSLGVVPLYISFSKIPPTHAVWPLVLSVLLQCSPGPSRLWPVLSHPLRDSRDLMRFCARVFRLAYISMISRHGFGFGVVTIFPWSLLTRHVYGLRRCLIYLSVV